MVNIFYSIYVHQDSPYLRMNANRQSMMSLKLRRLVLLLLVGVVVSVSPVGTIGRTPDISALVSPSNTTSSSSRVTECVENQCAARNRSKWQPTIGDIDGLERYGCSCDRTCSTFGDCCRDVPWYAPGPEGIACAYCGDCMSFTSPYIYTVSQCPTSWPSDATRRACESEDISLSDDPLAALPVTSPQSGRTYRNAACARCHEDTKEAVFWSVAVNCPMTTWDIPDEARKQNSSSVWLRRNKGGKWSLTTKDGSLAFNGCDTKVVVPSELTRLVRGCIPAVSDCAPDWADQETAAECAAYTARVRDMGRSSPRAGEYRHVYRNRHCALCNGIPPDKLQCGRLLDIPMLGGEGMSFSVLFDFSDRSGSDDVGAVDVCKGTSVWDPFFQKCREVFCDNGQLLDGDTCAPKNKPATSSTDFTPFQYCPKFYLSPNEFENRSDGSVYVQLYDQRYAEGEFELRDGELVVCSKSGDFSKFDATLGTLSLVFVVVSIVCLCCHLVLFCLVPEQRNLPGKNLAALCACLLVGYICFVAAPFQEPASEGCRALGVVMYAAFMASFFWMNVMAFDVFMSLRRAVTELRVTAGARLRPFLRYTLYTVTATACLVTSAVITDSSPRAAPAYRPGFGERVCWFSRRRALLMFFAVPLLVIMVANMALFVGSALIVRRAEQSTARVTCSPSKTNLKLCGRLAVISGLSWLVGLLAGWADFPLLWHIFIVLNTLQGVFIFGSFTVKAARSSALHRRRLPRQAPWSTVAGTGAGHGSEGPPTSETDI